MKMNEAAVFKWVVIVGVAVAAVIAITLLTNQTAGALVALALVIAGCVYGFRWMQQRRRAS